MNRVCMCLAVVVLCFLAACTGSTMRSGAVREEYRLSVTFPSGRAIHTRVRADQTFGATGADHDGVAYAIGGMMLPQEGGSIPLVLTIVAYKPEATQTGILQTSAKPYLILDQPLVLSAGPGPCTVMLTRQDSEVR